MIRSREGPLAEVTLERSVPGVFAIVTGQFVRAGKLPSTSLPVTVVGLLSRVRSHMRLEVRALGVGFAAALVRTLVDGLALATPCTATSLLRLRRGCEGCAVSVDGREEELHELRGGSGHHLTRLLHVVVLLLHVLVM